MREWESQSHVKWYCRYHIVIVPKYRHKAIFGALEEREQREEQLNLGIMVK